MLDMSFNELKRVVDFKPQEIVTFFGLLIAHAVHPWSGGIGENWGTQSHGVFHPGTFGRYMARNRYKQIVQFLHFCDNERIDTTEDKFAKIRLLLDEVQASFENAYTLGTHVSMDEGMWPTRSRYAPSKVNIKSKKHGRGWLTHMVCCASTGICTKFQLFQTGREDRCSGHAALPRLVEDLKGSRRVIYTDRLYTSIVNAIKLLEWDLFIVGTVKTNVAGFPKEIIMKRNEHLPRGTCRFVVTEIPQLGKVVASSWKDTGPVHFISTAFGLEQSVVARRVAGQREREHVSCLTAHQMYNAGMGGVDRSDYMRLASYSVQLSCSFRKWYRRAFSAILDLVIANSFLLWKVKHRGHRNYAGKQHGDFLKNLANELLNFHWNTDLRVRTPRENRSAQRHLSPFGHHLGVYGENEGHSGARKDQRFCFVCKTHYSSHFCIECEVTVCVTIHSGSEKTCFDQLHDNLDLLNKVERKKLRKKHKLKQ